MVRRTIKQPASREHAGGNREPDGIPIGLDFARGGPAGPCSAVEFFKARRVQEQRLHRRRHAVFPPQELRCSQHINFYSTRIGYLSEIPFSSKVPSAARLTHRRR